MAARERRANLVEVAFRKASKLKIDSCEEVETMIVVSLYIAVENNHTLIVGMLLGALLSPRFQLRL